MSFNNSNKIILFFSNFMVKNFIKNEGELLEFKFKADNPKEVLLDEQGFIKEIR